MVSKVALVKTDKGVSEAYRHALDLIGGIEDLNVEDRDVAIKVGIYDQRNLNYTTTETLRAVTDSFTRPRRIFLAESDNHQGKALDKLQVWRNVLSDRVIPFDLSHDTSTLAVSICGEKIKLSHVLFKPNVFVSLHVLRKGTAGSVFKNLLGLVPDTRKERFHDKLGAALVDMAEAVGGIDLAVIDGTYVYGSQWKEGEPLSRERRNVLVVGRDAVAVDAIGSTLAGEDPLSIPAIAVAKERRLGEADISRIEVLGESIREVL